MNDPLILYASLITLFLPVAGFALVTFSLGRIKKVFIGEISLMAVSLLSSVYILIDKLFLHPGVTSVFEFSWISFATGTGNQPINVKLGISVDSVTAILMFAVMLISFLVHLFSVEYMHGDKRFNRYFGYLGLFTFSMLGIVLTHNLLMMYIFWELVGLSSYLLIGFWFEKDSAADAAKKAFLVNRIGDIGMFLGILILFITYGTFTFSEIFAGIGSGKLPFDSEGWLTAAGILVFLGAVGKSAQFPLHVWLPDAMEGPTPVSALIHAATMVAAGVYLVIRIFVMLTADAMVFIAVIGALTAFISATIALTQNDIKKVLAYSTISQLGYMVMSLGVGAYAFAFFHLITHAFFKAGLFLGSGSVIHAMHHEQDIRNMGGLRKKMPVTYFSFLAYTLAICGIPLTSGFLSKDGILAGTYSFGLLTGHWLIPILGFSVVLLTAFYMFRLLFKTFHGKPADLHKYEHAHESPFLMAMPLVVLAVLSVFFWYGLNPASPDSAWFVSKWIDVPAKVVPESSNFSFMNTTATGGESLYNAEYTEAQHHAHFPTMIMSLLFDIVAIGLALLFYIYFKLNSRKLAAALPAVYNFSLRKWYFDEFYNGVIVKGTLLFSSGLYAFDKYIIDGIVNFSAYLTKLISRVSSAFDIIFVDGLVNFTAYINGFAGKHLRRIQTGKVQTYLVLVLFALLTLIILFKP